MNGPLAITWRWPDGARASVTYDSEAYPTPIWWARYESGGREYGNDVGIICDRLGTPLFRQARADAISRVAEWRRARFARPPFLW